MNAFGIGAHQRTDIQVFLSGRTVVAARRPSPSERIRPTTEWKRTNESFRRGSLAPCERRFDRTYDLAQTGKLGNGPQHNTAEVFLRRSLGYSSEALFGGKNLPSAQKPAPHLSQHSPGCHCTALARLPGSRWRLGGRHIDWASRSPVSSRKANAQALPATRRRKPSPYPHRVSNTSPRCGIDRNSSRRTFRHYYRIAWPRGRQYLAMKSREPDSSRHKIGRSRNQ